MTGATSKVYDNVLFLFKISHIWMSPPGRQLTIFNTQATVTIGGSDRSRPFQGQLSGLYYNGLKVLNMAAEGNPNIKINGSVRLVGDVPSVAGSARSTAMPPEMSTTFIETTTMMSTTTTRKHRSSTTVQVWTDLNNHKTEDILIICTEGEIMHPYLVQPKRLMKTWNQILTEVGNVIQVQLIQSAIDQTPACKTDGLCSVLLVLQRSKCVIKLVCLKLIRILSQQLAAISTVYAAYPRSGSVPVGVFINHT